MRRKKHRKVQIWAISIALIPFLILLMPTDSIERTFALNIKEPIKHQSSKNNVSIKKSAKIIHEQAEQLIQKQSLNDDNVSQKTKKEHVLTHEEVTRLTDEFMDKLVQETDENYQVIHFNTKESLLASFENITLPKIAKEYIDFYYLEEDGKLYIVPTETPPWFDEKNNYDMVQLNNNQIEIKQESKSSLYGVYTIKLEFTYHDERWKITNISHT